MKASGYSMNETQEALRAEHRRLKRRSLRLASSKTPDRAKITAAINELIKFEQEHKGQI